ncbi:hypothetical protein [Erythrobacter sp. MTPC3]|uniref:hypothetical protein n=1 Tax=Erythrobacter sp. MTPC3 TaxID=3056564 RepID=UPI0036F19F63
MIEAWTLESQSIRFLAIAHLIAAGSALFLLIVPAFGVLARVIIFIFNPSAITAFGVWAFAWVLCGVGVAAANFVWSMEAISKPHWLLIGKATGLSILILMTSPLWWAGNGSL